MGSVKVDFIIAVATLVALWFVAKKMGREGWEGIIPLYNFYVFCEELYGSGWKMLFMLIPLYNIYFMFKFSIDMAHHFNKSTGFGVGLVFLSPIFYLILAFSDAQWGDGSRANTNPDFVSNVVGKATGGSFMASRDENALEKIKSLEDMKNSGVISEEEFLLKKEELLKRI